MKILEKIKENKGKIIKGVLILGGIALGTAVIAVLSKGSKEDETPEMEAGDSYFEEISENSEESKEENV